MKNPKKILLVAGITTVATTGASASARSTSKPRLSFSSNKEWIDVIVGINQAAG